MSYPTINSLYKAFGRDNIQFLGTGYDFPYVQQDKTFRYFAKGTLTKSDTGSIINPDYLLVMESSRDLGVEK